ncbi:histidine kinase dimerization/phosphoacceptor domain-containing protein [Microbacterium terregens]|uniref:histidine kinase dimerization/phosphoacceptor domain-containing protein n=1 Tax=Microbacterium terregens TaxID=69363 RepID=UPI0031D30C6D
MSFVSETSGGVAVIALFTLAVHRPFRYVAWVAGVQTALVPLYFWWRPDPDLPFLASVVLLVVLTGAIVGWGMFVRSKRQLVLILRDRARRAARRRRGCGPEQAQRLAREAIAREMHDVLAHRLTLLSVHAGRAGVPARRTARGGRPGGRCDPGERPRGAPGPAGDHRRAAGRRVRGHGPAAADARRARRTGRRVPGGRL